MGKPERVVLYPDGSPLLLSGIKWDDAGKVKTAYVENGAWNFEIKGEECLAKEGKYIRHRWISQPYSCIDIPDTVRGGYNEVIEWAKNQAQGDT